MTCSTGEIIKSFDPKFADEILDYEADVSRDLRGGDEIVSATVDVTGSVVVVDTPIILGGVVRVVLSGGTAGETAAVNFLATTAAGLKLGISGRLPIIARPA